jgi:hypothetical protein
MAFHVPFGILVALGILGNTVALAWNCWRKDNRHQLVIVLTSSLAVADLFFSLQYFLQEVVVVQALATGRDSFVTFSETDRAVFLSMTFIGYTSCNAIMVTTVAIATYSFLVVRGSSNSNVFTITIVFVVLGWLASIGVAIAAVIEFRARMSLPIFHSALSVNVFTVLVMVGHMTPSMDVVLYPMTVSAFNALASVVCTFFYVSLWRMLRKKFHRNRSVYRDTRQIHVRLFVIVAVNVLGWWPACIEFLYTYISNERVMNGRFPVEAIIPAFITTAAACAANPIIYTIMSKSFLKPVIRTCFKRKSHQGNTERYRRCCCCKRMVQDDEQSTEETELWT